MPPSLTPGKFLSAIQACRKDTMLNSPSETYIKEVLLYGIQTRMSCPKIPLLKMTLGPSDTGITPRIPETLLNGPRTGGLELLIFQASKPFLMLPPSHHNFWRGGLFLKQDICSIPQTALYSCYKKEAVFDILSPCPHLLSL